MRQLTVAFVTLTLLTLGLPAGTLSAEDPGPLNGALPANCAEVLAANPGAPDGDYTISAGGQTFTIYCFDMAGTPKEYLTLVNTATGQNFAQYTVGGYISGTSVRTSYSKVRFDPATLVVDVTDPTFSSSVGAFLDFPDVTWIPYGVAANCDWAGPTGLANIDLRGTPFKVSDTFVLEGWYPVGGATFTSGDQVVDVTGGGECGQVAPSPGVSWYQSTGSSWVLDLAFFRSSQTITVTRSAPAPTQYGATFDVTAGATSGLDVDITVSGVCLLVDGGKNTATIEMTSGTGTCTVHYNQAGDASWEAAPEVTESTSALPADLEVAVTGGTGRVRSPATTTVTATVVLTASQGDVATAQLTVTLVPIGGGSPLTMSCGTPVIDAENLVATYTCTRAGVGVGAYEVDALGAGNYDGSGADVSVVYDPSLAASGGGSISTGDGGRLNFAFVMKFNKPGSSPQGGFIAIRHFPDGSLSRVKSNALDKLVANPRFSLGGGTCGLATFSGKAVYSQDVGGTWLSTGNQAVLVLAADCNEPGTGRDQIWMRGPGEFAFAGTSTAPTWATLIAGNIAVPHQVGSKK